MDLYEVVASVLRVEPSVLNEESNAQNTPNWDSIRHIELMLAVESAYHVSFSMPEMVGMRKLADMRQLLTEKGADMGANAQVRLSA
ncbi:MAG: acyl carrier protein [Pseudomonadota bacterium]